jgi:hypothetical protein
MGALIVRVAGTMNSIVGENPIKRAEARTSHMASWAASSTNAVEVVASDTVDVVLAAV